jgi:hypothetical protein
MVGAMEWSATGRAGASLADLQRVNFTFRAGVYTMIYTRPLRSST